MIKTLKEHTKIVRSVTFSPNGKYLAVGDICGTVEIWRVL
ncbi:hypothetical protein THMA_0628 [Thermotoga maritima MSB8]|uniref:Uncharacterized protein n=2 Tax=Thermotoga TaxID=2335 RepID=Q9WZ81_THEMA|nr:MULTISPECIES: WD40 repeat domain-containing protein [Thermotoga]AKE26535.1 hypothetical protein THMC_0628 [Thermotoga maritima]AAD35697.1 hypothetical protein TM_0612 [Thermotoga maritima MSB8]ABQ46331.1 WD-40 repeat protein [Thermotoga petrophila RKU-1]AGL49537.1 WD40 repeat-containing protein [Thermotoga maritima MSB8]AHD17632.1 hypothetical protein THEMA_01605 [Thermotoga maritima MSB8]